MTTQPDAGISPVERAWFGYARRIVRTSLDQPEHLSWCRSALQGAEYPHDDPAGDPTLRWPGYVGTAWEPGRGILFVGSVHADFTKNGQRHGDVQRIAIVKEMTTANRGWRNLDLPTDADDKTYLAATQRAYQLLAPGWTRGAVMSRLLAEAMPDEPDPWTQAAWTNLAHCRAQPRKTGREGEYPLQRMCSGKSGIFPLGVLVTALWPAAVIVSVSPFQTSDAKHYVLLPSPPTLDRPPGCPDPVVVAFAGGGRHAGKWRGRDAKDWVADVGGLIRERRAAIHTEGAE